jgi:phospholipid/cholesterol/gamma-HCH transport system substrate-binding protein
LQKVLPPMLLHLNSVTEVIDARLPALEQLLVTFPRLIAAGPSALTPDKFGRVNLNMNFDPPACTEGYLPPGQWRAPTEETFVPYYPAECASGAPINMRGMKYAPPPNDDWKK